MKEKIKIIIAEDHALYRNNIIRELTEFNEYEIVGVANGIELLEKLKKIKPDIILLDLEMPEMDGNAAFFKIRAAYPEIKIIIFSQHGEKVLVDNYMERGAAGYFPKNTVSDDMEKLNEALLKVHAGEKVVYYIDVPKHKILHTKREVEIMPLLCDGKTTSEIAGKLNIGKKAVEKHRDKIYKKIEVNSLAKFLKYAFKRGYDFLG